MICAGIDAGSRTIKVVLIDAETRQVVARGIADQGVAQKSLTEQVFLRTLEEPGLTPDEVARITATGYGRDLLDLADTTVTEITCHARGVHEQTPGARTIVDIGGQDSKVLRLAADGTVRDFNMNDRCAAGTGRFLEVMAERLGVPLENLGRLAGQSDAPAAISNTCVVFAETEIIGLLAGGARPADIAAGVQRAMAARIQAMAGRDVEDPVIFTGGVARVPGMTHALETALGHPVAVASDPQYTGALGAALIAADHV